MDPSLKELSSVFVLAVVAVWISEEPNFPSAAERVCLCKSVRKWLSLRLSEEKNLIILLGRLLSHLFNPLKILSLETTKNFQWKLYFFSSETRKEKQSNIVKGKDFQTELYFTSTIVYRTSTILFLRKHSLSFWGWSWWLCDWIWTQTLLWKRNQTNHRDQWVKSHLSSNKKDSFKHLLNF